MLRIGVLDHRVGSGDIRLAKESRRLRLICGFQTRQCSRSASPTSRVATGSELLGDGRHHHTTTTDSCDSNKNNNNKEDGTDRIGRIAAKRQRLCCYPVNPANPVFLLLPLLLLLHGGSSSDTNARRAAVWWLGVTTISAAQRRSTEVAATDRDRWTPEAPATTGTECSADTRAHMRIPVPADEKLIPLGNRIRVSVGRRDDPGVVFGARVRTPNEFLRSRPRQ